MFMEGTPGPASAEPGLKCAQNVSKGGPMTIGFKPV